MPPGHRMYSLQEVLNFTVEDILGPNFVDVKVKGWLKLTSEQREQCIMKLRDLVRQRNEKAQSMAVDANDLENRLNRVERSRFSTPVLPFDPDEPEQVAEDLEIERKAHKDLVGDNGRPGYPIELGFEVFHNPGQYKDLFEYWQGEIGVTEETNRLIFFSQLKRWQKFRQFQQENRRDFVFHHRFPEFQQEVLERRWRHGLDGNMRLLEEQNKQSKLDDWMEYQDYELRTYERLEKTFEEDQARLASRRQALHEAGVSAFEEIQELELASYCSLDLKCSGEKGTAEKKKKSAERKLRFADKRLKAAESNNLGESVERAAWVALFLKEVVSVQMRLDESQRLAEHAECELEPFTRWLQKIHTEWEEQRLGELQEAKPLRSLEFNSAEFQERYKKKNELAKQAHKADVAQSLAEKEVEFAEELHKAAQLDDFGETVDRVALVETIQEEIRSAQNQFEQARKSRENIILKKKVLKALTSISCTRGKMKRHNILLEWIEQQRRKIATSCADSKKEGGHGRSKRIRLRAIRSHSATDLLRLNQNTKVNGRKWKQSTTRSILSPVDSAKVSKAPSKRRRPRQKMSVPCSASRAVEITDTDFGIPDSKSNQTFKVKGAISPFLGPIQSSRISKPGQKRLNGLSGDSSKLLPTTGTHRSTRADNLGTLPITSTGRKAMQQSADASLRRSTRTSKPPQRFCPGIM